MGMLHGVHGQTVDDKASHLSPKPES